MDGAELRNQIEGLSARYCYETGNYPNTLTVSAEVMRMLKATGDVVFYSNGNRKFLGMNLVRDIGFPEHTIKVEEL